MTRYFINLISTIALFVLQQNIAFGQYQWKFDFEDSIYTKKYLFVDTAMKTNIWQIGKPRKILFDSAHSPSHAIVTDTIGPYSKSDTSIFVIKNNCPNFPSIASFFILSFYSKINTDSLHAFGKVEVSGDTGKTWVDIIRYDSLYNLKWSTPKPILTGTSNIWQPYSINISPLFAYYYHYSTLPTLCLIRFKFESDSMQSNKDGWIIDDIVIQIGLAPGLENIYIESNISVFPNPVVNKLIISSSLNEELYISIYDLFGKELFQSINDFQELSIDLSGFTPGMYYLYVKDKNSMIVSIKKFILLE